MFNFLQNPYKLYYVLLKRNKNNAKVYYFKQGVLTYLQYLNVDNTFSTTVEYNAYYNGYSLAMYLENN